MAKTGFFLHSPFSALTLKDEKSKALALQFTLSALIESLHDAKEQLYENLYSLPTFHFNREEGSLNKLSEHVVLLKFAFPEALERIFHLNEKISSIILEITKHEYRITSISGQNILFLKLIEFLLLLDPLILSCKKCGFLTFFLLKQRQAFQDLGLFSHLHELLLKMFPEGTGAMRYFLKEYFKKRGFENLISEIESTIDYLGAIDGT